MKRFNEYLPLTSLACVFCLSASAAADLVIRDVDLIDVTKRQIQHSVTIVIESGRISQVVAAEAVDVEVDVGDATVIGGSGLVAMPGFVNAHTHLWQHAVRGLETAGGLQRWSPWSTSSSTTARAKKCMRSLSRQRPRPFCPG